MTEIIKPHETREEALETIRDPEKAFESAFEKFLHHPTQPLPLEFAGPNGKKWLRLFYLGGQADLTLVLMMDVLMPKPTKKEGDESCPSK
jgi:hypothetical protein